MEKSKNKIYLIILIFMIVLGFVVLIIFGDVKNKNKDNYLILSDGRIFDFSNNKLIDITTMDQLYNWKKYKVFNENKYMQTSQLYVFKDKVYFGPKDDLDYFKNPILAVSENAKFNMLNYAVEKLSEKDLQLLNAELNKKGIEYYSNLSINKKVVLNENETLYVVSNYDYQNMTDKMFSLVYILENGKIKYMNSSYKMNEKGELNIYDLFAIFKYGKQNKNAILLTRTDFDEYCNIMYVKTGETYKEEISC